MDIYISCPKCGAEGLEPSWHASCSVKDKNRKRSFVNASDTEHLHYFCECGYDFIRPIRKKD